MKEIWKDIQGYEEYYQISNYGNVKSLKQWCGNKYIDKWKSCERIIKQAINYHGYKYVILSKNKKSQKKYVHRLVAEAFISNFDKLKEVNHKDGNKENNCVDNLEWCTRSYNVFHSYKKGLLIPKRSKNNNSSKSVRQYTVEGKYIKTWDCIKDASRELNINDTSISRCCKNKKKTAGGFIWEYEKKGVK